MGKALAKDRLGTDPVGKLLFRMAAPSVVAMVMQAMYNTIDSVYVAKISSASLAAITLAYPIQMITGAMSTGIGVGINSSISRSLGEGHPEKSSKAAANGMLLGLISLVIMVLFGLFGVRWYLGLYTDDAAVIEAGLIYIRTICLLSIGTIFTQISFSILQGSGNMLIPMVCQIAGCLTVLGLDPLFILVFKMGVGGAALASSTAQIISMFIGLFGVFYVNRKNLPIRRGDFKPQGAVLKDILSVGVPSALTQATTSIVSGIVNKIVAQYGTATISVYGGFSRISTFGILPIFGVTRGMNPILGYSYGAKNKKRFTQTQRLACITASIISSVTGLFLLLFPNVALGMISASQEMLTFGVNAYRILSISLFINGISISLSQCFPPAKRSYLTMIYSVLRQLAFLIPLTLLLSKIWGRTGVWIGLVITDYLAFFVILFMSIWFRRTVLNKWDENPINENNTAITQEAN
ncbi:MAG: MATE family efflux transporter [Spirochaetales bacterium]|nr:MATE family efflux transporter [Spirochaetales bacterium]MBO7349762.1 MATE family efflux transporter [Spirochaetales bacterium]